MSTNADILMRAFASDWGKGKPPALEGASYPDAELIVPESTPYGGGVFRGRERIEKWFTEDLWQLWAEFSSTPTDFIDGGDGAVRRARVIADTAKIRGAVTGGTQRRA